MKDTHTHTHTHRTRLMKVTYSDSSCASSLAVTWGGPSMQTPGALPSLKSESVCVCVCVCVYEA